MSNIAVKHMDTDDIPEELLTALQPTLLKWEAAILRVAAAHDPQRKQSWTKGSVEELLSKRFEKIPPHIQLRAENKADAILTTGPFVKRAKSVLGVNITDPVVQLPLAPQSAIKPTKPELERLARFAEKFVPAAAVNESPDSPIHNRLGLQFVRVACIDETNGWFDTEKGSDEISIGGVRFDTDGITAEIEPVDLGGDWDDGDVRDFSPAKSIMGYSLKGNEKKFPRAVFATLVLFERDGGGMQKILKQMVDKIAAEVKTSLTALLAAAIGAGVGGPIGALIGLAVGYAIDKLVQWLAKLWDDIPFIPKTIQVDVPSRRSTFNGSLTMPSTVVRFTGPGEYACRYQWVLS